MTHNFDGSLDDLVQHEPPARGANGVWLPVPNGRFALVMRAYPRTATRIIIRRSSGSPRSADYASRAPGRGKPQIPYVGGQRIDAGGIGVPSEHETPARADESVKAPATLP